VSSEEDIVALEARLRQVGARLQMDLTALAVELENLVVGGGKQGVSAQATAVAAKFRLPTTGTAVTTSLLPAPPVLAGAFASDLDALNYVVGLLTVGIKDRPYDGHLFAVASEPLNAQGNTTDIGRPADFIMVLPSIDAQLEFDKSVDSATPVVSGGTLYKHPQRVRKINHKATSTTLVGTVSYWSYWWNS